MITNFNNYNNLKKTSYFKEKQSNDVTKKINTNAKTQPSKQDNNDNTLISSLEKDLTNEYSKKFSNVDNKIKSLFDTLKSQFEKIESKDEYVICIQDFEDVLTKTGDAIRNVRRDCLKRILESEKYKKNVLQLRENDAFKKIELTTFRKTEAYKLIQSAIDQIFNTIKTSVDFNKLNIKSSQDDLSKLQETSKTKTFYGITKSESTSNYISEDFNNYITEISDNDENKERRGPEKNITKEDLLSGDLPQLLEALITRCFDKLNDVDKTVLKHYQNNEDYKDYVKNNLPVKGITPYMTDEGIVCLCGLASNKFLPSKSEEETSDNDDIDLELQKINYDGGSSKATIRYSQVDTVRKDGQFFELRISPAVKVKTEKGRAAIVVRTVNSEDDSELSTKYGKLMSVLDILKELSDSNSDSGYSGKGRRR